jgi:hypothetical protein
MRHVGSLITRAVVGGYPATAGRAGAGRAVSPGRQRVRADRSDRIAATAGQERSMMMMVKGADRSDHN